MQFLKPTTDIVFKKLFGDQRRTELTISFLNSVLERKEGDLITHVQINDGSLLPEIRDSKTSFIDVRCTDQVGKQYIVEMRVIFQRDFLERAQYYSAASLSRQLKRGEEYGKLAPVIFVGVLDFELFEHKRYLTHHLISDSATGKQSLHHLEYHFLELPKFNKNIEQVSTMTEKWAWFIKEADIMGEIPRQMRGDEEFCEAFHVLERSGWSDAEFDAYEKMLDFERVEKSRYSSALEIGLERGLERGIQQGIEKGIEQGIGKGIEKGRGEEKKEIARKMLAKGNSIESIAEITQLTPEEIKKLR